VAELGAEAVLESAELGDDGSFEGEGDEAAEGLGFRVHGSTFDSNQIPNAKSSILNPQCSIPDGLGIFDL
jgi:hypothetical protein